MKRAHGAVLLLILLVLGVLAAYFTLSTMGMVPTDRERATSLALAQAKEALIGFATGYRYRVNANEGFGYLPCPDRDNDGTADPPCLAASVSVLGRVPWRTQSMGIAPLRDSAGECLWYALSGVAKDNPKTVPLNWDTPGQWLIQDADGTVLAGSTPHERAWAALISPQAALAGQNRAGALSECGGNLAPGNALEGANVAPAAGAVSTLTLGTRASRQAGNNNDQGNWISSQDIFDRVVRRADFKADIDNMLSDLTVCLNGLAPSDPALATSPGNKGVDNMLGACPANGAVRSNVLANWRNNLLYTRPAGASSVNGVPGCASVLLFAGARTQRSAAPLSAQVRATAAQTGSGALFGDPAMYLEGGNTVFPASGAYAGPGYFNAAAASADLVRCIKGLPPGSTQESFARDLVSFTATGVGVTRNAATESVNLTGVAAGGGGCFWSPHAVALAGKTLRAYHEFIFAFADNYAVSGSGADRGGGFTLQLVSAKPGAAPDGCGSVAAMGALGSSDAWGAHSIIVQTDVQRDPLDADPVENYTAILLNGSSDHHPVGASMSTACDASATACRHTPANRFEESPPAAHRQRVEVHSGCNAGCDVCDSASVAPPNDHLRVTAWVDCVDCSDVTLDLDRVAHGPTLQRCLSPDAALAFVYYGLTGGFKSGAAQQGVSLSHFVLRSE